MSAQPTAPNKAPDQVSIEIDGKSMTVPKGSMIIQAADDAGIPIPRFCYHKKLAIAANCRMCLVDVEKAPKPMPACATPVMEGMKVFTQSRRSLDAQRNVMEFLLINHPLDCPICDQGGECELQDLAMGYGRSVSRFAERKRVVPDEDLGPLVSTEMTRCIQCTRCVRFSSEIAGTNELGGMGRGEHLEIGTYVGKALESELGGNVIDVCPVGALTNKVFRFRARAWELIARESLGYHDALGSNLYLHTRRGEVLRIVPRENEAINECWLSDRDRYSHEGLYADDRATRPMIRNEQGTLEAVPWDDAIRFVADALKRNVLAHGPEQLGALVSPATSSEEGLLLAQLLHSLGCENLDHRLRLLDAGDASAGQVFEMPLVDIAQADAILLVGADPARDAPILGHRIRTAARRGGRVYSVDMVERATTYELAGRIVATPSGLVDQMLALARAAAEFAPAHPNAELAAAIGAASVGNGARAIVEGLRQGASKVVLFGDAAVQHPRATLLRALARYLARACEAKYDELAQGANAVGLRAVGVVPHGAGLNVPAMLAEPRKTLVLYGAEVPHDFADGAGALRALAEAEFVVAFSAFVDPRLAAMADAILPIGLTPEIDATLVNVDGAVQSLAAGSKLPGEARPGWRILRAIGAAVGLPGFEFTEIAQLRARLGSTKGGDMPQNRVAARPQSSSGLERIGSVPIYRVDAVTRRAEALQRTPLARAPAVVLHPEDALARGLGDGALATVGDGRGNVELPVEISTRVPRGAAWIESGHEATASLGPTGSRLEIGKAGA